MMRRVIVGWISVDRLPIDTFPESGAFVVGEGVEEGFAEGVVWVEAVSVGTVGIRDRRGSWSATAVCSVGTIVMMMSVVVVGGFRVG